MKQIVFWSGVLLSAFTLHAQTRLDLRTQGKGVDFADAVSTRPAKTGSALPPTCSTGDLFFLSTAPGGKNLYGCAGTNVWAVQAAGSELPNSTNNSGKILTTDGTDSLWSSAGGDIGGAVDSLTVTRIRGRNVSASAPANGQALVWNSTSGAWEPMLVEGGAGAVSSVSGRIGAVVLNTSDFTDCAAVRTSAIVLTINACQFSFPNRNKTTLSPVTITAVSGAGTAYIYLTKDATLFVGHSGSLAITCSNCTDAGPMITFPEDTVRLAIWPATLVAGQWDTTGITDERAIVRGSMQFTPGQGISISTGPLGEKQLSLNTAGAQTKAATQAGQELACMGAGSAAAQTCSMAPMLTAYTPGMRIQFRPATDNSGAQTLNIDNRGALAIKLANGLTDPAASELSAGNYYDLTYDGAVLRLPSRASAGVGIVTTPTTSGAQLSIDSALVQTKAAAQAGQEVLCSGSGSAAAQTCTMSPALAAYTPGMRIRFQPGTANTGAQTVAADGLAAKAIKKSDGSTDPGNGELVANGYYDLTYDGAVFRLAPGTSGGGGGSSPKTIEYIGAKCQNGFAASGFSFATTGFPTAACVTGTNTVGGVLQFTDASTQSVQDRFILPSTVTAADLDIWWRTAATNFNAVWQLQTACVATGEDGDLAWNTAQTVTTPAQGIAGRWQKATIAGVALTGCAAGEVLRFKLFRDPAHVSDDLAATAELISAFFTVTP